MATSTTASSSDPLKAQSGFGKLSGRDKLPAMKCTQRCFAILSPAPWLQLLLALGGALVADRMAAAAPAEAFAGRWDLTIQDANHKQLPSWLELTVDQGIWKASFVGRWGNARPLPKVVVQGNKIQFISPKEEEDSRNDLVFDGQLLEGTLTGSAKGPNGTPWTWTGQPAPALKQLAIEYQVV